MCENLTVGVCNRRNKLRIGSELCVWRATLQKIKNKKWILLERLRFGENFEVNVLEGYVISTQCNVDFGYRLSFCSWAEKNNGKPGSN